MKSRRGISIFLALVLSISLIACGDSAKEKKVEKHLYEQGLDVVELMVEVINNDDYVELIGATDAISEYVKEIAEGDFDKLKEVYAVTGMTEALDEIMDLDELEDLELSKKLEKSVENRMVSALITQLNAREGTIALASSSVCAVGKTFVEENLDQNMIYIYIYKDSLPVVVTFIPGEDGSVSVGGNFLMSAEFAEDVNELLDVLEDMDLEIEEVDFQDF